MSTSLEQRSEANSGLSAGGGQASIQFQDEGSNLGTAGTATTVNFTGAGVTASRATNTVTVNVPVASQLPVGSVYENVLDATNPATLLGYGTWLALGPGRVLVGIDAGDADFDLLGETGGAKTSAHAHGYGTLATSGGSWHSHGLGTLATVAESSHTHSYGSIAVANHDLTHKHNIDSAGLATISSHSGTAVANHSTIDHRHVIGASATISAHGTHSHGTKTATLGSGSSPYYDTATDPGNHTLGGYVNYSGQGELGHSVTQPSAHTLGGTTQDVASYSAISHSVSGSSAAGSSHSHGVSGAVADEGSHTHGVSGSTGSDSPSIVQPYIVVHRWYRSV